MTKSTNGGKSFADEKAVFDEPTGVCGCCGSKALADRENTVYLLFRAATNPVHRDMYLLSSTEAAGTPAIARSPPRSAQSRFVTVQGLAASKLNIVYHQERQGDGAADLA